MVALVIIDTCCVALMAVLVAGLLRSHADILRALHRLGAGVGDPSGRGGDRGAREPVPLRMGPALAPGRHSTEAHDVAGVTPAGDAVAISATAGDGETLLVFLSSGCASCAEIWRSLDGRSGTVLPDGLRVVVVTKGPDMESPDAVRRQAPPGVTVIMSSAAWSDYEVQGSPFFVLLDTGAGRRVGEGMASHLAQVVELVRRAADEARPPSGRDRRAAGEDGGGSGRTEGGRSDGPAREAHNDRRLREAGVLPGDRSLYPRRLEDVFIRGDGGK